jgi:hypothetical protein
MNVEIIVREEERVCEEAYEGWEEFFEEAAAGMGIAAGDLENILIADKANYGRAVLRLGGRSYTADGSGGVPFGKAISRFGDGNRVKCSIVLSLETFEQIGIARAKPAEIRNAVEGWPSRGLRRGLEKISTQDLGAIATIYLLCNRSAGLRTAPQTDVSDIWPLPPTNRMLNATDLLLLISFVLESRLTRVRILIKVELARANSRKGAICPAEKNEDFSP